MSIINYYICNKIEKGMLQSFNRIEILKEINLT